MPIQKYSIPQKAKALEMYLYSATSVNAIGEKLGINPCSIRNWMQKDKWNDKRRKLEHDLQERSAYAAEKLIRENRCSVLQRQLDVSKQIEEQAGALISNAIEKKGTIGPEDLMLISKAFNSSARISGKAVGVDTRNKRDNPTPVAVMISNNFEPKRTIPEPVDNERLVINVTPDAATASIDLDDVPF